MTLNSLQVLEQLGTQAHGHFKAGEKHNDRAEAQMVSAGVLLLEAQEKIRLRKDINFAKFLLDFCPIGKTRAYEIIAISNGTKTYEQVTQRRSMFRDKERQEREERREQESDRNGLSARAEYQPEKANENNKSPKSEPKAAPIKAIKTIAEEAHEALLKDVLAKVRKLSTQQLIALDLKQDVCLGS